MNTAVRVFVVFAIVVIVDSESNKKESACRGEWKWPKDCNGYGCVYALQWMYIDDTDDIQFVVSTKNRNKWTGVGFSADKLMPETDAVVGLVPETGRFFVMDMWLNGYEVPPLDQNQNLHNMTAWTENGITSIQFYRKRVTGDKYDFQFTDDNCPYLVFPVEGGLFNAVNKRIRQHESTPIVSEDRICIKSCSAKKPIETTPKPKVEEERKKELISASKETNKETDSNVLKPVSTTEVAVTVEAKEVPVEDLDHGESPESEADAETHNENTDKVLIPNEAIEMSTISVPAIAMATGAPQSTTEKELTSALKPVFCSFDFKLLNAWTPNLVMKNSSEYKNLKKLIEETFRSELESKVVLREVITTEMVPGDDPQSVIATVNVQLLDISDRSMNDGSVPLELKDNIKAVIANNKFGDYASDANSLLFKSSDTNVEIPPKVKNNAFQLSEEQLKWIVIIGGVAALVLLVVIQALCMLWRDNRNKKKSSVKEKQMVNSHWKDYSATTASSAYCYENFAVSDDLDGIHRVKQQGKSRNGLSSKTKPGQAPGEKGDYSTPYLSATMDRQKYMSAKDRELMYGGLPDRRDEEGRFYSGSHTLPPLQPDFYFMPHQRRYSGEVVRVFVDYNNPHPKNVRK